MVMPGRSYTVGSGYRYGFNGKEDDKDISEGGQDYGMRIYDSRLGRFLSVDPLSREYPFYGPYNFAANTPVNAVDIDGMEVDPAKNRNVAESSPSISRGIGNAVKSFFTSLLVDNGVSLGATLHQSKPKENGGKQLLNQLGGYTQGFGVAGALNSFTGNKAPAKNKEVIAEDITTEVLNGLLLWIGSKLGGASKPKQNIPTVKTTANTVETTSSTAVTQATTATEIAQPPKTFTSTWVENGQVSQKLVDRYNKLNTKERPLLKFTPAGKEVVKDINKEVNGGNMQCTTCGVQVVPAPKSTRGVTPAPNEAHVDHYFRREDGGSGTPVNGMYLVRIVTLL